MELSLKMKLMKTKSKIDQVKNSQILLRKLNNLSKWLKVKTKK